METEISKNTAAAGWAYQVDMIKALSSPGEVHWES